MKLSSLTGKDNYYEDFSVGMVFRHARGKTVEALENVLITNMVMNTAQAHFNEHAMLETLFKTRLSYGGVNFSISMGLASQDCYEQALAEMAMNNIGLKTPVVHGDRCCQVRRWCFDRCKGDSAGMQKPIRQRKGSQAC